MAIILPIVSGLLTQTVYFRLRPRGASQVRPVIYIILISAFQLIYETIIATLSVTYMIPSNNCRFEEQWMTLYKSKQASAIARIQDRFECCGFNTPVDRAWPFPHGRPGDGFGADQCTRTTGRVRSCGGPWRQAEQLEAGLFFMVAKVTFIVKVCNKIFLIAHTLRSRRREYVVRYLEYFAAALLRFFQKGFKRLQL